MKDGLRVKLIEYAKQRPFEWVNGGTLERLAGELGYKMSNASRRLRELENDNVLEVRYNEKKCAEYRYKGYPLPQDTKSVKKITIQPQPIMPSLTLFPVTPQEVEAALNPGRWAS